jgi:hypothetical protein
MTRTRITASICAAAVAVVALALAAPAIANFLTVKEARSATFNVMREECDKVPTCQGFQAGPCVRVSDRKVRCLGHFYGRNKRTGPYDCHRQVAIRIYPGSDQRFYKASERRCTTNEDHPVE